MRISRGGRCGPLAHPPALGANGCTDHYYLLSPGCPQLSLCVADSWRCPKHHFCYWDRKALADLAGTGSPAVPVLFFSRRGHGQSTLCSWATSGPGQGLLWPLAATLSLSLRLHVAPMCPQFALQLHLAEPGPCPPSQAKGEQGHASTLPCDPHPPLLVAVVSGLVPSPSCSVTLKITE